MGTCARLLTASPLLPPPGALVLHVRQLAVAAEARRAGLASRLLARPETEARARGARSGVRVRLAAGGQAGAGRHLPFYEAAGYTPRPDIADFYAEGSVASGADCPYCGAPPCRCAARPFVKALAPA